MTTSPFPSTRRRSPAWVALVAVSSAGCAAWSDPGPRGLSPDALPADLARVTSQDLPAGPLTLEHALALALDRNPGLRAVRQRLGEAHARLAEAEAAFYPQVSGRVTYLGTDNPAQAFGLIVAQRRFSPTDDVNDPGYTEGFRPEVVVSFPVFRGGADWAGREAASLGVEASAHEQAAVRNALQAAVVSAFHLALAAREQVGVTEASAAAVERELADARTRLATGTAVRAEVLSLEVRLAEAREGTLRARNAVDRAHTALRALLACPAGHPLELAEPARDDGEDLPLTLEEALARAGAQRPELLRAERFVSIREREVDREWGAYLPRVDLFGSYGHDERDLELTRERDNFAVGVQVELDLFGGFRTASRVQAARHRLAEAREELAAARLHVQQEVADAFLTLGEAQERVRVTEAAVSAAEEAFELVRVQYETGGETVTRLLGTEAARAGARSRAVAARHDLRRARAELRRALGAWAEEGR